LTVVPKPLLQVDGAIPPPRTYMDANLAHLLHAQARRQPHAVALIDGTGRRTRTLTFAELDAQAGKAAGLLQRHGLAAGDRVLIFHPMAADLYVAIAAFLRLGLVAVFVDPSAGRAHIERCCELAPPAGLLATPKAHLLRLVSPALRRIPHKFATGIGAPSAVRWANLHRLPASAEIVPCPAQTPALATFTSGSTGAPKMAVRSHGFLHQQHRVLADLQQIGEGDVVLSTLPIFVLSHIAAGACTLIPSVDLRRPGHVRGEPLFRQMAEQGVTCIEASPALLEQVTLYATAAGVTLPRLTKVFTGGGPVFPRLLQRTRQMAPNARITAVYGSTEAEPITHLDPEEISERDLHAVAEGAGLPAGLPVPAAHVRVLPDTWGRPIPPLSVEEFQRQVLSAGATGEIVVSGPHVLAGYWQGQGDAETKFRVGETVWHRTGDAGYFDEQGRLWLLGRCMARIEDREPTGRGALYPFAVEAAVYRYTQVKRAAFVEHRGRRLLIVEGYGSVKDDLPQRLLRELDWARIDQVRVVRRLPVDKRHNAKIDYGALRRILD